MSVSSSVCPTPILHSVEELMNKDHDFVAVRPFVEALQSLDASVGVLESRIDQSSHGSLYLAPLKSACTAVAESLEHHGIGHIEIEPLVAAIFSTISNLASPAALPMHDVSFFLPRFVDFQAITLHSALKSTDIYPTPAVHDLVAGSAERKSLPKFMAPSVELKQDESVPSTSHKVDWQKMIQWNLSYMGRAKLILAHWVYPQMLLYSGRTLAGVPQDMSIIHQDHPVPLFIPVICVADDENIMSLVASTVYQRCILGIRLPVIGLKLNTKQCIVQLVIAWSEEPRPMDSLPQVHVATTLSDSPSTSTSVFHLSSYHEVLKLAYLCFAVREYLPKHPDRDFRPTRQGWRSDHSQYDYACMQDWGYENEDNEPWMRSMAVDAPSLASQGDEVRFTDTNHDGVNHDEAQEGTLVEGNDTTEAGCCSEDHTDRAADDEEDADAEDCSVHERDMKDEGSDISSGGDTVEGEDVDAEDEADEEDKANDVDSQGNPNHAVAVDAPLLKHRTLLFAGPRSARVHTLEDGGRTNAFSWLFERSVYNISRYFNSEDADCIAFFGNPPTALNILLEAYGNVTTDAWPKQLSLSSTTVMDANRSLGPRHDWAVATGLNNISQAFSEYHAKMPLLSTATADSAAEDVAVAEASQRSNLLLVLSIFSDAFCMDQARHTHRELSQKLKPQLDRPIFRDSTHMGGDYEDLFMKEGSYHALWDRLLQHFTTKKDKCIYRHHLPIQYARNLARDGYTLGQQKDEASKFYAAWQADQDPLTEADDHLYGGLRHNRSFWQNTLSSLRHKRSSGKASLASNSIDQEPSAGMCHAVVIPMTSHNPQDCDSHPLYLFDLPEALTSGCLVVPLLFVVYTTLYDNESVLKENLRRDLCMNEADFQSRMCCVSGVVFLQALGTSAWPVWTLTISGTRGRLSACIHDPSVGPLDEAGNHIGRNYILEHGARIYDLTKAVDILQLAIALIKIRNIGLEMHDKLSASSKPGGAARHSMQQMGGRMSPRHNRHQESTAALDNVHRAEDFIDKSRLYSWTQDAQNKQLA